MERVQLTPADYQIILSDIADSIILVDDSGHGIYATESHLQMIGYSEADFNGAYLFAYIHPEDLPRVLALKAEFALHPENIVHLDYRVRCFNNTYMSLRSVARYATLSVGRVMIVTSHEISKQDELERALEAERVQVRTEEARYRSILENVPIGVHIYHLDDDGRLIFTGGNPAAEKMLRINHAQLVGKTLEEAFPGNIGTDIPPSYKQVAQEGGIKQWPEVPYHFGSISGTFQVDAFGIGNHDMVVTFTDVSAAKKNQSDLLVHTAELEKMNRFMVDRELKMIELKKENLRLRTLLDAGGSS